MGLGNAIHKLRRKLGLPAITLGNVAKLASKTKAGKQGIAKLGSGLESAGVAVKGVQTKAERAIATKIKQLTPPKLAPNTGTPPQVMPGGAPIKDRRTAVVAASKPKPVRAKAPRKPRKSKSKGAAPKRSGSGRKPPTGGLDLKGLSASWKKAGKPGTWQQWIAQNK